MKEISRREFAALVAAGVVSGGFAVPTAFGRSTISSAVTADDIIERMRDHVGVEWASETVDTVKGGDPSTVVTGVVTTAMATMDVLRRAVRAGSNFVITSEPTFYSRADSRSPSGDQTDAIYAAKNQFIAANGLVIFRFSDHWWLRRPNPFEQGLADALFGLGTYRISDDSIRYDIPAVRLGDFVNDVKRRLDSRGGIRVVGNPELQVRSAALLPGSTPITASLEALPSADVVVAGEVREWESAEYARDVVFSGQSKALVLVGRVVSQEPGMRVCVRWLETFVPEVPIRHFSAGDPYWNPAT